MTHSRAPVAVAAGLALFATLFGAGLLLRPDHGPASTPRNAPAASATAVAATSGPATPTRQHVAPNLVGSNAADAVTILASRGLAARLESADARATVVLVPSNWRVIGQSVPEGEEVPDRVLVLYCVKITG